MKVNIKIYFDDDEKILCKNFPKDLLDEAVKRASQKGLDVINECMSEIMSIVELYNYLDNKGGGVS